MKVIDPGYEYELASYDGDVEIKLTFMKRMGDNYPDNMSSHAGTNIQEVLRVLLDRMEYLDKHRHTERNNDVFRYLRLAMATLEDTAHSEKGENTHYEYNVYERNYYELHRFRIEKLPTCAVCGCIDCNMEH